MWAKPYLLYWILYSVLWVNPRVSKKPSKPLRALRSTATDRKLQFQDRAQPLENPCKSRLFFLVAPIIHLIPDFLFKRFDPGKAGILYVIVFLCSHCQRSFNVYLHKITVSFIPLFLQRLLSFLHRHSNNRSRIRSHNRSRNGCRRIRSRTYHRPLLLCSKYSQ